MKVLFVCTGNTCRSAMAEGIYNSLSEGAFSRGLCATGEAASEKAIVVMEKMGIDISRHISRQLTTLDVEEADLILTMTRGHKMTVLSACPDSEGKVFTLGEYVQGADVSDPYGGDEKVYAACADEIYGYIKKVIEKLK